MLSNQRKFKLALLTLFLGLIFGIYCVEQNIELSDAGVYYGVICVNTAAYMSVNMYQKKLTNGNNNTPPTK